MSRSTYVVVSPADDNQIPFVERHLDAPFTLLDTRDILRGSTCSYVFKDGITSLVRAGQKFESVKSVWYRRYMLVQGFELPVHKERQSYAQAAIRYFNKLFFAQLNDALWVSDFFAIERANDKLWQLQMAAKLGFNVPDTLFTSSPKDALAFARSHKTAVAKPNYSMRFQHEGKEYVFYTSRVDPSTDFSGLKVAPAILQAGIDVKTELRITVVGNKVFTTAVNSNSSFTSNHIRDWRVDNLNHETVFESFDLTKKVTDRCVKLVKDLGLQFGAIDAIIDVRGKLWFLENNPVGQWAFIEVATGLPIGKAIADLLMRGKRN